MVFTSKTRDGSKKKPLNPNKGKGHDPDMTENRRAQKEVIEAVDKIIEHCGGVVPDAVLRDGRRKRSGKRPVAQWCFTQTPRRLQWSSLTSFTLRSSVHVRSKA